MHEKDKFPSSFASSQFVKYVDRKEIKTVVETLGHTISQQYAGQDLVLVGVLKGSMTFLADLARHRADEREVVGAGGDPREEVRHLDAGLAMEQYGIRKLIKV